MRATLRLVAAALSAAMPIGFAGLSTALALEEGDYVGRVGLVGAEYCPPIALEADGRLLPINQNSALYSLIGNTYGGDVAKGTFALPDLRQKVPAQGLIYCIVVYGIYPSKY